jgi:hypothetical protein
MNRRLWGVGTSVLALAMAGCSLSRAARQASAPEVAFEPVTITGDLRW